MITPPTFADPHNLVTREGGNWAGATGHEDPSMFTFAELRASQAVASSPKRNQACQPRHSALEVESEKQDEGPTIMTAIPTN
jgi:hypothetical protein